MNNTDNIYKKRIRDLEKKAVYPTTTYYFEPDQLVLWRLKRLTKITPKAIGPYVVLKVGGQFGQKVTIQLRD